MAYYTEIYRIAITLNILHIYYNLHTRYNHNFYHDKQDKFDNCFDQYHISIFIDIDNPAFIQELRQKYCCCCL